MTFLFIVSIQENLLSVNCVLRFCSQDFHVYTMSFRSYFYYVVKYFAQ